MKTSRRGAAAIRIRYTSGKVASLHPGRENVLHNCLVGAELIRAQLPELGGKLKS